MQKFIEIITMANTPTGNGQIYSKSILTDAFDIYMSKDKLLRGGCIHAPHNEYIKEIDISHYLERVWFDGDYFMGEVEIVETPMGDILQGLLDSGIAVTLGLAALVAFKPMPVVSRNLFEIYPEDDEFSKEVDSMAVITVYATLKSNTTH